MLSKKTMLFSENEMCMFPCSFFYMLMFYNVSVKFLCISWLVKGKVRICKTVKMAVKKKQLREIAISGQESAKNTNFPLSETR